MSSRVKKVAGQLIPRCPLCDAPMEEVQLKWEENPLNPLVKCWHEVWGCSSCHTNHVFPARVEFLEKVGVSAYLPKAERVLYLPRGVGS